MKFTKKRIRTEFLFALCFSLMLLFIAAGFSPDAVSAKQVFSAREGQNEVLSESGNAPASINLEVRTALEYRKLKAGQFTFRLMDREHNFISTAVNGADGKVGAVKKLTANQKEKELEFAK